jgi:hypothetical protein
MADNDTRRVKEILAEHGCAFVRRGKGDHHSAIDGRGLHQVDAHPEKCPEQPGDDGPLHLVGTAGDGRNLGRQGPAAVHRRFGIVGEIGTPYASCRIDAVAASASRSR